MAETASQALLRKLQDALEMVHTRSAEMGMGHALIAVTEAARAGVTLTADHHAALYAVLTSVNDGWASMLWGHYVQDRIAGDELIERLRPATDRLHRTLIRVLMVEPTTLRARIPGWNPHKTVRIDKSHYDESAQPWSQITPGTYFLAMVNIGELDPNKLRFSQWEVGPSVDQQ